MRLRWRPATACDLRTYTQHLTVRGRYGSLFDLLPEIWCALLRREALFSAVVEDLDAGASPRSLGLSVSVFLADEFVREAKTPPLFWIGPEIVRRVSGNASPILDSPAIGRANWRGGLTVFRWEVDVRPAAEANFFSAATKLAQAFFDNHAGFQIRELISQQPFGRMLEAAIQFGSRVWDPERGLYSPSADAAALDPPGSPFVLGLTREIAREQPGSWLSSLFDYALPRLHFTRAEQRLLSAALRGRTDEEIAGTLEISLSAVKKGWQSIYAKVGVRMPDLLPDDSYELPAGAGRGSEKKRRVLSYLQDHPEELRPLSPPLPSPASIARETSLKQNRAR